MTTTFDETFLKTRKAQLKSLKDPKTPITYIIERFSVDGSYMATKIEQSNGTWIRTDTAPNLATLSRDIGEADSIYEMLLIERDPININNEMTFIHTTNIPVGNILKIINAFTDGNPAPDETLWEDSPIYEEWQENILDIEERELNFVNDTPNGLTISDSLLVIDGHHTKLVTGKDFVGFMAMDPDCDSDTPLITDVLWSESWHRESGGPVSWDGGTTVGFAGPFVLAEIPSGDVFDEPSVWSIPENFLPQEYILMDLQSHENSVTAFLLSAIGLPDLPGDAYNNWLNKDFDGDGHTVYVNLPEHRIRQVIDALCAASPHSKRIVEALRDSSTPLGKKVYETFESVLDRTDNMWSILDVLNGGDE